MAGRGFTLLEILVTLLILGVMAGVAVPAFLAEQTELDLADAEGRIEALFRLARDSAIVSGDPVTVVMDSASTLVWLDVRGYPGAEPSSSEPPSGEPSVEGSFGGGSTLGRASIGMRAPEPGQSLDLPTTVQLEQFGARTRFTFLPTGAASGDSIVLRASTGELRVITVDPWTGHARIR